LASDQETLVWKTGDAIVKRRSEAGQTLPIVALALLTLLAAAGLAVDMGYMRYQKRIMQSAADAAALAAATDLNLGFTGGGVAQTDALDVAAANGFTDGMNNTTVAYSNPGIGPGTAAQVSIQKIYPAIFMQVVGITNSTINAVGTATLSTSPGCIYALDPAGTGVTLNAGVSAPNCGIVDNGPLNGSGDITSASVGVFQSFAGYGGVSSPNAVFAIPQPAADPLATLIAPAPGGPCIADPNVTGASGPGMDGIVTLNPGNYCTGITIKGGGIVTFNEGLYFLDGTTGLHITGTGTATSSGNGVTFYNTGSGAFTFDGIGSISLSASIDALDTLPSGILFFQDPGNTAAADVSGAGAIGNVQLNGTMYFPTAPLTIAGSIIGTNAVMVAGSITVTGSILLTADSTSVPGGSQLQSVSLVQ
jgi:Flp pilus assembly protein TadG